jgi:dihydrofolate reductase
MIAAIVAVDANWGIGYKGDLLYYIPEDLKRFKDITTNNIVVMGRKTWDSLPKKPLLNRANIVITSSSCDSEDASFWSMESVKKFMKQQKSLNFFIIGGGTIYQQLLPYCDKIYVTKIHKESDRIDTYFPNLDKMDEWKVSRCDGIYFCKDIAFQFLEYERIN